MTTTSAPGELGLLLVPLLTTGISNRRKRATMRRPSRGPGQTPTHNGQRYALTRGGVRCTNHSLTPATTATMMPVTTWTQVGVAWAANPTAHADTATQTPSKRLIHSSHSANASSAASATTPIATPLSQAFQLAAALGTKPKIHGVRNSQAPKTRLITSAIVSRFSSCSIGRPPLAFAAISAESPPSPRVDRDAFRLARRPYRHCEYAVATRRVHLELLNFFHRGARSGHISAR